MTTGNGPELMWGIGLDIEDAELLRRVSGEDFVLRNWTDGRLPGDEDMERETPLLVWIPASVWKSLSGDRKSALVHWERPLRVLILDVTDEDLAFETLVEKGFLTAVRHPLSQEVIQDVLCRAKELSGLYGDIVRMTKEIILERELLSRKTDQLMFLNRVLTRASESLDAGTILTRASEDMASIFALQSLQAAFWREDEDGSVIAEIFLSDALAGGDRSTWMGNFLEQAVRLGGRSVDSYTIRSLRDDSEHSPSPRKSLVMPLSSGGTVFGCLAITPEPGVRLAKDQVQTINAAVSHLSLALRNAFLYREVRNRAEFDGLTRIPNRQNFDRRLMEEMRRQQRNHHDLSLLMLDLDRFKVVNDEYGHAAGDMVLREVARIMRETVRSTDFPARYGGEEFVAILPYTSEEQAWTLAERLREAIAGRTFHADGNAFHITASIGIASLSPGERDPVDDLLRQADRALYFAKANGRNMVCLPSPLRTAACGN